MGRSGRSRGSNGWDVGPHRRRPPNAVPPPDPRRERWVRVIAVVTLAYWAYYIVWRWGWTLNPDALWFSIPLAAAETWGLVATLVTVHSIWRLRYRQPLPAPPGRTVDVFITCYDEPLEVVRRTAVGARAIDYPHRTWVLDDGKRDEVRRMADELGVGYLRREGNEHAKAGNLNHALEHTDGELILQLDADHVPLPHILDRLLGFFEEDPRLAFVQTPQDFYNTDAFTYAVDEQSRRIWEEQRLFFGVIQPGKDSINSTFFCGCSALIRREAVESVGGFATGTITEDIETSLRLHAAGWNSAYYGESLVYGLAAHSAVAFHTQHLRWGQGAMQVLRRINPLTVPGLTLHQRISYFGSLTAYVGGLQKLIFYVAPPLYFFTGVLPIQSLDAAFMARFLPYLALSLILSEAWARGRTRTWMSERFHMAKFWTYTRAVFSIVNRRPRRFAVTPKRAGHVPFGTYAPQAVVAAATAASAVWAVAAWRFGLPGHDPGVGALAYLTNGLWGAVNVAVALSVVRMSLGAQTQQRGDHRFRDRFAVHLAVPGAGGRLRSRMAVAEDLNPGGVALRISVPPRQGERVRVTLPLRTGMVEAWGRVAYAAPVAETGGLHRVGIELEPLSPALRDRVELHCTQHAVPLEQSQYAIAPRLAERAMDWMRNARREPRHLVGFPASVWTGRSRRESTAAVLEEISAGGARLLMEEPLAPETRIHFSVPGTTIRGSGRVVFARAIETPIGVRFAVGVQQGRRRDVTNSYEERTKMKRSNDLKRHSAAAAAALAVAIAAPATAQIQPVVFGAAEFDTEDTRLFLAGATVHSPAMGTGWVAGVMAYHLTFPDGAGTRSLTAVQPSVGVRIGRETGAVQATVGYAFVSGGDALLGVGAPGGGESGVVTTVQANHWGTGAQTAQAIATYNWGAEYLWTNLRTAWRVSGGGMDPTGTLALGAEAGFQGSTGGGDGAYRALQAGAVAEYQVSAPLRLVGVVGARTDNRATSADVFPYVKLEFVLVPGAF